VRTGKTVPWRRLFSYLKPHKWRMAIAIVGLIISSGVSLVFPLFIGQTIADVLNQGNLAQLNQFVALLVGLFVLMAIASFIQSYFLGVTGEKIVFELRTQLYQRLITLPLAFYGQHRVGELVSRLSSDVTLVRSMLTTSITTILSSIISLVGSVIIVFTLNPSLTVFILLLAPALIAIAFFFGRPLERMSTRVQDDLASATVTVEEGLSGIRTVKSFVREDYEDRRYRRDLGITLQSAIRAVKARSAFGSLMLFLGFGSIAAILWFGGRQVIEGTMTVGMITSFLIYGFLIAASLGSLAGLYGEFRAATGAIRRTFELLDTETTIVEAANARPIASVQGGITFKNVSFGYEAAAHVLRNVSLDIQPGEIIALVGPSGAGKSTLFNLIPRFYDPDEGTVSIDGHDLRSVTKHSLRSQIGLVPQEAILFGGTVRENIRYGRLDATEEEVVAAAKAAYAHDFILSLPQGYDTPVGERGTKLSGGQRQRVAIARAILKDPRILLLDEATSSLDSESEQAVQAALDVLMRNRTTVIIAHRLSTIQSAHRVIVLDHGRVVEIGTHDELLAINGLYAKLYTMQFSRDGYATEVVDRWPSGDLAYEFEFGPLQTSDIS
jgi:subfamily B ATP-binding cassette protein MsbA